MLVNLTKILPRAREGKYAIGAFNMTALETALAIIEAAEEEHSPVILQISEKTIDFMGFELSLTVARMLADNAKVPVAVHLDHGKNLELVTKAIESGYPSIMADLSTIDPDKRIKIGKELVEQAHQMNVTVELEEDSIAGKEDYITGTGIKFTDPTRAAKFVNATGCDAFAVAIGSAHGKPQPGEKLDLDLLCDIAKVAPVPLVLHGASSTPDDIIREAISRGICKINIDTDLRVAFSKSVRATLGDGSIYDPRDYLHPAKDAVKQVVREKIRLFGSENKA